VETRTYGRMLSFLQFQAPRGEDDFENSVSRTYWAAVQAYAVIGSHTIVDPVTNKIRVGVRYKRKFPFIHLSLTDTIFIVPMTYIQGPVNIVPDFAWGAKATRYILPLLPS
jgi:hypothetical protein